MHRLNDQILVFSEEDMQHNNGILKLSFVYYISLKMACEHILTVYIMVIKKENTNNYFCWNIEYNCMYM